MAVSLSNFKPAACPSISQQNGVLMRPQRCSRLITQAATSHKLDKAVSAPPSGHSIRKFEKKDGLKTAGLQSPNQAGLRGNRNNAANQKLRVAVDVDEGKQAMLREAP